jgi:hypothetical protein
MEMRIWPVATFVGLAVPAAFAGGVSGRAPGEIGPVNGPTLSMSRAGLTAEATPGSMCTQPPSSEMSSPGICVDTGYPLPVYGRLPVRAGGPVVLESSVEASDLNAHLTRVRGGRFTPVGGRLTIRRLSAKRWAVTLPARLHCASVLDVLLRWNNPRDGRGDANFWGGIRQGRR